MPLHSAALLAYHRDGDLFVLLAHPGGPFFARKDDGHWSLPKGVYDPATEDPWAAARREFTEEIGAPAPDGPALDLGTVTLKSRKVVHAFAVEAPAGLGFVASNTFDLEWPRGSGRTRSYPEVDRAEWFPLEQARLKIHPGQAVLLDRLAAEIDRIVTESDG